MSISNEYENDAVNRMLFYINVMYTGLVTKAKFVNNSNTLQDTEKCSK